MMRDEGTRPINRYLIMHKYTVCDWARQDKYSNYTEKIYPNLETKVKSIVFIRKKAFSQELMDCSPS